MCGINILSYFIGQMSTVIHALCTLVSQSNAKAYETNYRRACCIRHSQHYVYAAVWIETSRERERERERGRGELTDGGDDGDDGGEGEVGGFERQLVERVGPQLLDVARVARDAQHLLVAGVRRPADEHADHLPRLVARELGDRRRLRRVQRLAVRDDDEHLPTTSSADALESHRRPFHGFRPNLKLFFFSHSTSVSRDRRPVLDHFYFRSAVLDHVA